MTDFAQKKSYNFQDLVRIVALLRAPDGCPWDREQTHASIQMNFIEETYEVVDAIQQNDAHLLCEELGDVLLQVALHAQMEAETGAFTIDDVADGICKKLIYRHPHVFGTTVAETTKEVLQNWEKLKIAEKHRESVGDNMDSVPRAMPALMRAAKVQKRAAGTKLEYQDAFGALADLQSEVAELAAALQVNDKDAAASELGDVLLSAVNVSRFIKCNAEQRLTASTDRFAARVKAMDALAAQQGKTLSDINEEELDKMWKEAKKVASK